MCRELECAELCVPRQALVARREGAGSGVTRLGETSSSHMLLNHGIAKDESAGEGRMTTAEIAMREGEHG